MEKTAQELAEKQKAEKAEGPEQQQQTQGHQARQLQMIEILESIDLGIKDLVQLQKDKADLLRDIRQADGNGN